MSKTSNFIAGAFLGAAIGSILGFLFAPKSGEELCKDLQEKANQITVEVKNAAAQKQQELEKEMNSFKTKS